ncbi:hypothetical protein PMAYCL1PPCAC_15167, partial [Pristionchus mayeri]
MGIVSNLIALYLVHSKSRKNLTQYKKLLSIFLIADLFYTLLQDLLKPKIIVSGQLFLLFSLGSMNSKALLSIYCGCVSMSFVIISFNFVFRAIAISDKEYCHSNLNWKKLTIIVMIFIFQSLVWGALTHINFTYENSYKIPTRKYFASINYEFPDDPLNELIIFGVNQSKSISTGIIITIVYVETIVGVCVTGIIGSSIFIVKRLSSNTLSSTWRRFHKQLFISLIVQLMIPCFLLYIPCSLFVVMPFFGFASSYTTPPWLLTTVFSLYPIVDPLAIIFLIGDYRIAFVQLIRK